MNPFMVHRRGSLKKYQNAAYLDGIKATLASTK